MRRSRRSGMLISQFGAFHASLINQVSLFLLLRVRHVRLVAAER